MDGARDQLPDDMMAELDSEVRGGENVPPRPEHALSVGWAMVATASASRATSAARCPYA